MLYWCVGSHLLLKSFIQYISILYLKRSVSLPSPAAADQLDRTNDQQKLISGEAETWNSVLQTELS